jgi:hypothetical protein
MAPFTTPKTANARAARAAAALPCRAVQLGPRDRPVCEGAQDVEPALDQQLLKQHKTMLLKALPRRLRKLWHNQIQLAQLLLIQILTRPLQLSAKAKQLRVQQRLVQSQFLK